MFSETCSVRVWRAEIVAAVLADEDWQTVAREGTDDPAVFAAYLKALRWGTATAADRDLFQAPFRAASGSTPTSRRLRNPPIVLLGYDTPSRPGSVRFV